MHLRKLTVNFQKLTVNVQKLTIESTPFSERHQCWHPLYAVSEKPSNENTRNIYNKIQKTKFDNDIV